MILIDNTVLSNFALAEEMQLLENYCKGKGATSKEVLAEFERGVNEGIFRRFRLSSFVLKVLILLYIPFYVNCFSEDLLLPDT
ncbi:MAG: hypothetical protein AB1498_12900 [bacterium]